MSDDFDPSQVNTSINPDRNLRRRIKNKEKEVKFYEGALIGLAVGLIWAAIQK